MLRTVPLLSLVVVLCSLSVPAAGAAGGPGGPPAAQQALPDHALPAAPWVCDLDVDADRDGVVEPVSDEDDAGEEFWTEAKGAVFLFNNDDDDQDGAIDAAEEWVNGTADELDLAAILLQAMPAMPASWTGELAIDPESEGWVRLFRKQGGAWTLFDPDWDNPISAAEVAAGIAFAIEALDFAQTAAGAPGCWSGEVVATFTIRDRFGRGRSSDSVRLRVAPFLLYSNLAPGETAYVVEKTYTTDFVAALAAPVAAAGAVLDPIDGIIMGPSYDIWAQDAMEFGYAAVPSPGGGLRTLPSVLRSPRDEPLDAWTKDHRLGPDFGYVFKGWYRPGVGWIDWFGNLDCTPPLPGWPLGRIYTGCQGSTTMHPKVLEFLEAQRVQAPVLQIDTDWLLIGHVDEEICFVPASTGAPYRMVMPSTASALQILEDLQNAGKGGLVVFAGTSDQTTVNGLLSWTTFVNYNAALQADIDGVRQQMKTGLGIAEADIIDLPALFWKYSGDRAIAHMPNMVNALVLGDRFITSDPFGPVDGGVDRFKEPVVQALSAIGLTVDFVDDWYPYHEWLGEVHCGTNAVRTPPAAPWWSAK